MARTRGIGWPLGAALIFAIGLAVRVGVAGTGVGDRSAIVLGLLLTAGAWLAARLVAGPRTALFVTLAAVALLDLAALPPRDAPPYDDLQAFYRTDQVLSTELAAPPGGTSSVSVLVQPVFSGALPRFGLAGEVNGTEATWSCPFVRGIQWVTLPVAVNQPAAKVELHLTGSPSREGDYLIVYASSRQGGYLVAPGSPDPNATRCSAA